MNIVVQKYGGTSVGSIEKIKFVARRVINEKEKGNEVVVVVSAMGKTTDNLINMSKEICNNPNKRELDMLLSTGEQMSISLLSMALEAEGYKSISLTGFQAGIKTQGIHTKNKIADIDVRKVKKYLQEGKIVVVAGFQGINEDGDITTLGRGGSDTTAVAIAAKLKCPCEIYTDVDGIYSIDPRVYKEAKKIDYISYEEMMEMASLGAGVMDARAVEIGCKYNVPIYVSLNTGDVKGTWIKEYDERMEERVITGLTISENNLMITINNVLFKSNNIAMIFERLAQSFINIDMISQTAPANGYVNVSFTASKDDLETIKDVITKIKDEILGINISVELNITKVSVIGIGMMNQSGVTAKVFKIFAENNIEFKQVTTSEISISFAIDSKDKQKAANILAKELNL
ncbi:aspartate kinase [Clostridium sp. NSJ-145]|uniref:aspartate kinase n=1 Tax=Clostridium sp. NSJ-145 TaxID=2897777 RepID=UPI001E3F9974|nr:aspartate kinase [Clostridium sp. NSJ-145]MCD2500381.1 aspartate kinase [Clostridium sp. NSJ-145]MDU6340860.1 aspartate kinase [Clostridium sp.]